MGFSVAKNKGTGNNNEVSRQNSNSNKERIYDTQIRTQIHTGDKNKLAVIVEEANSLANILLQQNSGTKEEEKEATLRINIAFNDLNRLFRAVKLELKPHAAMLEGFRIAREIYIITMKGKPQQIKDSK